MTARSTVRSMKQRGLWYVVLVLPALLLLCVFFVWPTINVGRSSLFDPHFTLIHLEKFVGQPVYWKVTWNTIKASIYVTLLCTVLGYPAAYFIANLKKPGHQVVCAMLLILTLWVSIIIRSYSWMIILGSEGIVNSVLQALSFNPVRILYTSFANILAMTQILLPLQVLICLGTLTQIDKELMKAARILGAHKNQAFFRIYFPLSIPGLINGASIVFMLSMGFFITPALLGGRHDVFLGNIIEQQILTLNWQFGSVNALVLLTFAICGYVIIQLIGKLLKIIFKSKL